jgi:hypothetical protein
MQQIYFVPKHICSVITVVSIVVIAGLTGCTTTSLQNIAVEGPLFQPPVHITQDSMSSIRLHPWITMVTQESRTGRVPGHTLVTDKGVYQIDTNKNTTPYTYTEPNGVNKFAFHGTNYSWQLPSAQYGLDLDIHSIAQGYGLCFGGCFAPLHDESYWQAYAMFSAITCGKVIAARVDFGVEWQNLTYTADFVHNSNNDITFFKIHNQETRVNPFVSFTLNGTTKTSAIHPFLQGSIVKQTLFSITDAPSESSFLNECSEKHMLYSLSPGLSMQLAKDALIIIGIRFIWDGSMDSETTTIFQPLLQFDIGL